MLLDVGFGIIIILDNRDHIASFNPDVLRLIVYIADQRSSEVMILEVKQLQPTSPLFITILSDSISTSNQSRKPSALCA